VHRLGHEQAQRLEGDRRGDDAEGERARQPVPDPEHRNGRAGPQRDDDQPPGVVGDRAAGQREQPAEQLEVERPVLREDVAVQRVAVHEVAQVD
jgi:hypothetical protein